MFTDIARQFSKESEPLRLPLEQIPLSKRPLQLSQWIHYILLSNNIMLNIKLTSLIQKNVDTLSAPNPSDIQPWLDALKPEGKVNLVTENYRLLLFMLHLRFIYEKFPVKMFEIKFIALKLAESYLNALDENRSKKRLYSFAIMGISASVLVGCLYKLLR
ncbi:hypothetical protein TNCT_443311 [Trichonephila clavata]|uniref:Uncharacterized protein n=1 Tax=Trichonephila clavata TaxID=2740835 RepID=A0A8X6KEV9_TRICU|nr:hypothetical protein TNCT_448401 [Trichonephila clavata]GFR32864.1 hypothetical protein TNCT_443311 [Trichonephila clavata]